MGDERCLQAVMSVYSGGMYSVMKEMRADQTSSASSATSISADLICLIWRIYLHLLDQCQTSSTSRLRLQQVMQRSDRDRRQMLRTFEDSDALIQSHHQRLQAWADDLRHRAHNVNQRCLELMQRRRQAQIRYRIERDAAFTLEKEMDELGHNLIKLQTRAEAAAARHELIRRQVEEEKDRIGNIMRDIDELRVEVNHARSSDDDVEQISGRVRSRTADLNNLVARSTLCKNMVDNAQRSLQQFHQEIVPLRASTVALVGSIQTVHWMARRAALRLSYATATLSVAVALGRQLKSCDDRWTRAIVQAESVLDRYGADLDQYDGMLQELGEGHELTRTLIDAHRDIPDRLQREAHHPAKDDADLGHRLTLWRRKRRWARRDRARAEGQIGSERACRDRIVRELDLARDVTMPGMFQELDRLQTLVRDRKTRLAASTSALQSQSGRWRCQREQRQMLIEDLRSRRELMLARRHKSEASRGRYVSMIEAESRAVQHWVERSAQLDIEIDRGRAVIRHEKDQQMVIVARDAERQRQRTQMLSQLTQTEAELSQAQEQIDDVRHQTQQTLITSSTAVTNLTRARAAAHADLVQVQHQHDQLLKQQLDQRQYAMQRIQMQRDHVQIKSDQMRERRDRLFDQLIQRARDIRQAEFVHRKLHHELDQLREVLRAERATIQGVIEERFLAGRKTTTIQSDIDGCRQSRDDCAGEFGRQSLSLHLRAHAAVESAGRNRRLRAQIEDVVESVGPVEFAIGQYLASLYNRSVSVIESTQTALSVSHCEIQTDDVH